MGSFVRGVKVQRVEGCIDAGPGEAHLLKDQAAKHIAEGDQIRPRTTARDLIDQGLAESGDERLEDLI